MAIKHAKILTKPNNPAKEISTDAWNDSHVGTNEHGHTSADDGGLIQLGAGQQGIQGIPGRDGVDGRTPIKGVDYFDGSNGSNGTNGLPGYTPIKGVDYFDGAPGSQGIQGVPGNNGAPGTQGQPGIQGTKGDKGDTGNQGIQGNPGTQGIQGVPGVKGDPGDPANIAAHEQAYTHSNIHAPGSDNQDLSNLVVKVTNKSLVLDTEIAKIHAAGSDNQDLSGKENVGVAASAVSTHAALKTGVHGVLNSIWVRTQVSPDAETVAVTLTIAELLMGIITGNPAGAVAYTLPTGTLCDAGMTIAVDEAFDWVLSNIATTAANIITLTAGTGHTIVGCAKVPSNSTTTGGLWGTSAATFRTRKTATNTFVTYRVG